MSGSSARVRAHKKSLLYIRGIWVLLYWEQLREKVLKHRNKTRCTMKMCSLRGLQHWASPYASNHIQNVTKGWINNSMGTYVTWPHHEEIDACVKSSIFWDIAPCNRLKVNRRFGETRRSACHLYSRWFFARLILRPWRWKRHVPQKRRLTFNGLHGVISQKIEGFITAAVRTANPTDACIFRVLYHTWIWPLGVFVTKGCTNQPISSVLSGCLSVLCPY
jgi:hypothetical protein